MMFSVNQLDQEAHVWFVLPESVQDRSTLEYCLSTLSKSETMRWQRLRVPDDRHRYLISHAMLRNVLSMYVDVPPGDWEFRNNRYGRPEVDNPDLPALRFNLTHTSGLAACVITQTHDCGIDAEKIVARRSFLKVAKRMFSEYEHARLCELSGRHQLEYFFECWTLREAYVKARGIGISFPTHRLRFDVGSDAGVRVAFAPELAQRSENWQLELLRLSDEHITAVAFAREDHSKKIIPRYFDIANPGH